MLSLDEWTSGFAASEQIQRVRPKGTDRLLQNPHRGATTFQRFEGDALQADHSWHDEDGPIRFEPPPASPKPPYSGFYPATRVTYCRWPWSVLEPEHGRYRFDYIHSALKAAEQHKQSLQIRFEPFVMDDIPTWYRALGAKVLPSNRPGPEIDSTDPLYLKHWRTFVLAVGREFNAHPNLDSVDIAYAGRYGEMGGNATPEIAAALVDPYIQAFPDTFLLSMIGTDGCAYAARANKTNIGWRGDGFLDVKFRAPGVVPDGLTWHHMFDEYPRHLIEQGLRDVWMHAPVSLEPYHTVWHLLNAEGFSRDIKWQLDQCLKYHPSTFMAKSVEIPAEWKDTWTAFENRLGYRFHVHQIILPREVKPGQTASVALTIDNRGVAPIYKRYFFALRFVQGEHRQVIRLNTDIRRWLPDFSYEKENFHIPSALKPGPARVDCGIVDANDQPRVELSMDERLDDGWHPLTYVNVLKS